MWNFQYPSCQATCEAAPGFAGKSVVCPQCGRTAQVPRDAGAAAAPPAPVALPPLTAVTTYLRWLKDTANPVEELYDLQADPLQERNLVAEAAHQETLRQLRARWQQLRKDLE